MDLLLLRQTLERAGVSFEHGLSDVELDAAERRFAFTFPPDLRRFLAFALPSGGRYPTWRDLDNPQLADAFNWPYQGMCFDIERNTFWPTEWGPKPPELEAAYSVAATHIGAAPKLIPICGHRYMPDRPSAAGNPVFSVYQTDIIYYGGSLENYLQNEYPYYFETSRYSLPDNIRQIEFWSWLVDLNS